MLALHDASVPAAIHTMSVHGCMCQALCGSQGAIAQTSFLQTNGEVTQVYGIVPHLREAWNDPGHRVANGLRP